jgi:hypothetical protein
MLDQLAYWIGYAILAVGGVTVAAVLCGLALWQIAEWYWRRYGDYKALREYFLWKSRGWNPFPKTETAANAPREVTE